jgi:hypothetical protein
MAQEDCEIFLSACGTGDCERVGQLLENGADISCRDQVRVIDQICLNFLRTNQLHFTKLVLKVMSKWSLCS